VRKNLTLIENSNKFLTAIQPWLKLMLGVDQSSNSIMFWVMKEAPTFNQTTLMALQHSSATALWLKLFIDQSRKLRYLMLPLRNGI